MKLFDVLTEAKAKESTPFDVVPLEKSEQPPKSNGRTSTHVDHWRERRFPYIDYLNAQAAKLAKLVGPNLMIEAYAPFNLPVGFASVGRLHDGRYDDGKIIFVRFEMGASGKPDTGRPVDPSIMEAVKTYQASIKPFWHIESQFKYYKARRNAEADSERQLKDRRRQAAAEGRRLRSAQTKLRNAAKAKYK